MMLAVLNVSAQEKEGIDYSQYYSPVIDSSAYAVLKDSVLTFYYGNKRRKHALVINSYKLLNTEDASKDGFLFDLNQRAPKWNNRASEIKKVVFHSSFKKYRPISCYEWFSGCFNLEEIKGMKENLNTENVVYMSAMFLGCIKLKSIDLSGFNTSQVKSMHSMFSCCNSVENLDLSNFKTDSLKNIAMMFDGCSMLKTINLTNFNTSNVTNMKRLFAGCSSLKTLDLINFKTSNVTNMKSLFAGCENLERIDLSGFDVSNCENMSFMFAGCGIKEIELSNFRFQDSKESNFMEGIFMDCKNLKSLDISHFKNVCYCKGMFFGCSNLKDIKLFEPRFDIEEYYTFGNFTGLFYGCSSLEELDLSMIKRVGCPLMSYMFANCYNLKTIYVDNDWNFHYADEMYCENFDGSLTIHVVENTMDTTNIFENCYNLVGGSGTKYSPENKNNFLMAQIDYGEEYRGYFTAKHTVQKVVQKTDVLIPANSKEITYFDDDKKELVRINKWGFVNQNGEWIIAPKYSSVRKFNDDGYARVYFNGQSKFIDKFGNSVEYQDNKSEIEHSYLNLKKTTELKIIRGNGKYGLVKDGIDTIVESRFDDILLRDFNYLPYARIRIANRYTSSFDKVGLIDNNGKILFEPRFNQIKFFKGVILAKEKYNGRWGIIDKRGNWIQKPKFVSIGNEYDWDYD